MEAATFQRRSRGHPWKSSLLNAHPVILDEDELTHQAAALDENDNGLNRAQWGNSCAGPYWICSLFALVGTLAVAGVLILLKLLPEDTPSWFSWLEDFISQAVESSLLPPSSAISSLSPPSPLLPIPTKFSPTLPMHPPPPSASPSPLPPHPPPPSASPSPLQPASLPLSPPICFNDIRLIDERNSTQNSIQVADALAGVWGGVCTCPDGNRYLVGDNADFCSSLACVGGKSGDCTRAVGRWQHRRVICGLPQTLSLFYQARSGVAAPIVSLGLPDVQQPRFSVWYGPVCLSATNMDVCFRVSGGESSSVLEGCTSLLLLGRSSSVHLPVALHVEATHQKSGVHAHTAVAQSATLHLEAAFAQPPSPPIEPRPKAPPPQPPPPPLLALPPREPPWRHPLPPPPYEMAGGLTAVQCNAMLRDPAHLFRRMWAAEPWGEMDGGRACWEVKRDSPTEMQRQQTYFDQAADGTHCHSNWYEGNAGQLGNQWKMPRFSSAAPAVLGFDEGIDRACGNHKGSGNHAASCVRSNMNILSLYGQRVPYNICRNLEWMMCAALGEIPGQRSSTIRFATTPHSLEVHGDRKPLGACGGWVPPRKGGSFGYTTDDIFFLEARM